MHRQVSQLNHASNTDCQKLKKIGN